MKPDEGIAASIAREHAGWAAVSVKRFTTGIGHWVYDVRGPSGEMVVVRIGSRDQEREFAGALHWSSLLRPLGVPLPEVLASGAHDGLPFLLLERLLGSDLGQVYEALSLEQKQAIAAEIVGIQERVATLGEGNGYGFVQLPDSVSLPSWRHVVDASIERSRTRIETARLRDMDGVRKVANCAIRFERYFSQIRPTPFLDDTTTKNVIVHRGELTGIVDVDWICFGDPLLTLALTRASLIGSNRDTDYTAHWARLLRTTAEQDAVIRFYTALFLLDFTSELGHRFNSDAPTITENEVARLERLLEAELHDV